MKRTTTSKYISWSRIPDAVCLKAEDDFTKIPNDILKNPNLSSSAKIILFLLFSNKEGWHSYLSSLKISMKESFPTIQKYIKELEKEGYVERIYYREKNTKIFRGSFLAYTDIPFQFDLSKSNQILDSMGYEPQDKKPSMVKATDGFFYSNKINYKKTKNTNPSTRARIESKMKIPPSIEDVKEYCNERNNGIDPEHFISYYESKGWKIGKEPMVNWKSAIITWEKRNKKRVQEQNRRGLGSRRSTVEHFKYHVDERI